ncbi:hypothetical protein WJX79_005481 [Trebouxia sp. C0005]
MRHRWSAHAGVILPLLAFTTLTLVTCRTTLSPLPMAPGGSWAKQSPVSVLTWMSKSVDRCNSGSIAWTCKMKILHQLLLDWCSVQIGAFQASHSIAGQSWCFLISSFAHVMVSGWVKIVKAFCHAFAHSVQQTIWLAMRPAGGVDWACLSLCGSCLVCALIVYRLYCKRTLRAALGVQHLPAQASLTLPSEPLASGKLNSAKLDAETLPDPHKGKEHQQKEVSDTVDATSNLDRAQDWPLLGTAASSAKRQAPAQMSRLPSAQASANPEVPAPLATAQAANDDADSSHVAADSAVAAGISAGQPVLASSSSAALVPADGLCTAVFGSLPDLRGVHTSLFLQQSGYLVTPLLGGTCNFCKY